MRLELTKWRYAVVFKWLVLVDMAAMIIMWIVGGALELQNQREIDQIVKFNFTHSVFDILLLASCKALILFVLVNELENASLWLIIKSRADINNNQDNDDDDTQILDISTTTSNNENVVINQSKERLIDRLGEQNMNSIEYYKSIKKICHLLIFVVSLVSLLFVITKFSFILTLVITQQKNADNEFQLHMHYLFFSMLVGELVFALVQFIFGSISWSRMRKLAQLTRAQLLANVSDVREGDEKKKKVNFKRLMSLSFPERYFILVAIFMLIIASVTNIAVPYFFGLVVDAAMNNPTLTEMNTYVVYMFLIFFVGSIAGGFRSWLFELSGQRVVARLRRDVFAAIIKQDISFFDTNRTGELTSRISSDSQVLQNAVTVNISMMLRYFIQIIGCVIFMFSLEASLTGLLLGIIPVVTFLAVYYGRYLRKLRKRFQDELASSNVIAEEAISSSRTVRSFAAETKVLSEYEKRVNKSFDVGKTLAMALGGFMAAVGILTAAAMSLVLWYGGKLVHDKKLSTGILASFLMYTLQVAMSFAFLSSLYGDMMQALGASQRIFDLLDSKPTISLDTGIKPQKNNTEDDQLFDGSVKLVDVEFAYPTSPETKVLRNFRLDIEKGKTIALVGPSGGGKSTVFSLIERFYEPESGRIELGPSGCHLKAVNSNWLHSQIALVSQEPVLFGGTIKENISFGVDDGVMINNIDERIIEAAKLANAHEFISAFEKGYDTVVGERGIRLSGGQKQRIAIARALLVNPKLLLLDEATSALDSESEHLVQEAIDNAMHGRTVCIIAHRLSTVRNANRVIVLENGHIVESGTHEELCKVDGIYKRLVLRQLLSNKE